MPELNAGSMADIAFLLLIFFLVVTTIAEDKGIPVILPEYYKGPPGEAIDRNVLAILVNGDNQVLVESRPSSIDMLRQIVIDFVDNPALQQDKPRQPSDAIISLQNDVATSYETYVQIYSHIHEAYQTLRNNLSQSIYQSDYEDLAIMDKNEILKRYPLKVSEADPFSPE